MPTFNTYEVTARTFTVGLLRSPAGRAGNVLRYLRLQNLTQEGKVNLNLTDDSGVNFSFYTKTPISLGVFTANGFVNVQTELGDFDDLYAIVKSAPEVIFTWKEDPARPGVIVSYILDVPEAEMGAD